MIGGKVLEYIPCGFVIFICRIGNSAQRPACNIIAAGLGMLRHGRYRGGGEGWPIASVVVVVASVALAAAVAAPLALFEPVGWLS